MLIHKTTRHNRRRRNSVTSYITIMTIASIGMMISTLRRDASRAFVCAAFSTTSSRRGTTAITGRTSSSAFATTKHNVYNYFNTFATVNRPRRHQQLSRCMSSTAATTDEDLDSALDEILGEIEENDTAAALSSTAAENTKELESEIDSLLSEALAEAENPAVDDEVGGRGHIEGSHPFPKELIEEQVSI